MIKTDKRDAFSLANQLSTQLELGAPVTDTFQVVRRTVPPSEAAAQLKGDIVTATNECMKVPSVETHSQRSVTNACQH